jgi:hypothetical protein
MHFPVEMKSLPIQLRLYPNRLISFACAPRFNAVYETYKDYNVLIDEDGLKFFGEKLASPQEYEYNSFIEWQQDKTLISWLKAQELVMPTFTQPNF